MGIEMVSFALGFGWKLNFLDSKETPTMKIYRGEAAQVG